MQWLDNIDWIKVGYDCLIIISSVVLAKVCQLILLKLMAHSGKWFHWQLNEKLESYSRRPLLLLLVSSFVSLAIIFTSMHDIWITRIQILLQVLSVVCLSWLLINIIRGLAEWLKYHYANGKDRDPYGARRITTQIHLMMRVVIAVIVIFTIIGIAITIPGLRQLGMSLFASAGLASLVIGMAANSTLSNLIAGIQIAITQPILLGDEVSISAWPSAVGIIEEIRASYVVVRFTDMGRMIIPLNYFMQNAFVNRTYASGLDGSLTFCADYATDIEKVRDYLKQIAEASDKWDRRVCELQVSGHKDSTVELKAFISANTTADLASLQSEIREKLVIPLQRERIAAANAIH